MHIQTNMIVETVFLRDYEPNDSFNTQTNMIVGTVFFVIRNQTELCLVYSNEYDRGDYEKNPLEL